MIVTPLLLVGTPVLAWICVLLWEGTIFTTYALCVHQDHCPAFLPTISDTWVYPPGNYLSRWTVSIGCVILGWCQWIIFFINQTAISAGSVVILATGTFAVFCLSWVGAICVNSTAPSCYGNSDVHTAFAVTFFVLYDLQMVYITTHPNPSSNGNSTANITDAILTSISLCTKVRFFIVEDQTALAILEWVDVAAIMTWTIRYILTRADNYYLGIFDRQINLEVSKESSQDGQVELLVGIGAKRVAKFSVLLCVSTVLASFISALNRGQIHPKESWPFISDLWVSPLGNYFSRWGVMLGCSCMWTVQIFLYFMSTIPSNSTSSLPASLLGISLVAIFGLSVVGCVNENEDFPVHVTGALTFFIGYGVYMVATSVNSGFKWACTLLSLLCKIRFATRWMMWLLGDVEQVSLNNWKSILEWTDLAVMLTFLAFSVLGDETSDRFCVGLCRQVSVPVTEARPLLLDIDD